MYERIIEIMVIILAEMTGKNEITDIDFDKLNSLGYSNEEITTAFSWLIEKLNELKTLRKSGIDSKEYSFRILNKVEKDLFTTETWGEILNLKTLGILSNENIESIIDWAIFVGIEKVDKTNLYNYLAYNIFNLQSQHGKGFRYVQFGNDKIN